MPTPDPSLLLCLSVSLSGDGVASEGFWRAGRSLQPGHVLPGPAEAVHQRQERPDTAPPEIKPPASRTNMKGSTETMRRSTADFFIRTPCTFFAFMPSLLDHCTSEYSSCCYCPLLALNGTRMFLFPVEPQWRDLTVLNSAADSESTHENRNDESRSCKA